MGRRKIEIKAIKDDRNRSVTFLKRKGGLFKKAHELSVLCSVNVAVIIFGTNKKLYEYSSTDMRELITRYTYHGGPNEHKGPADYNGGNDDEDESGADGTPPQRHSVDPQMMPPQFQGQPPYSHMRNHTPSASPPIPNGAVFQQHPGHPGPRGHTPQPHMGSRPSSRNDVRRMGSNMMPQHPGAQGQQGPVNGFAYMPNPAIYNPQTTPPMPPNGLPQHHPQYPPYPPPQPQAGQAPHPQMPPQYMEDQRRSSLPPNYPPQQPQQPQHPPVSRPEPSPQPHPQQLPQPPAHMSPPPPQPQQLEPPPPQRQPQEPQPPGPGEVKRELPERPQVPLLNTDAAIKRLPQRKQHSIFTPIDENRSILSQHLASFTTEPESIKGEGSRSQSVDVPAVSRTNGSLSKSPPGPQRANTQTLGKSRPPVSIPETTFTPPSRSNSLKVGGGASRPRLKVQIPDGDSENGGSATGGDTTSPRLNTDTAAQSARPHIIQVLPPPSPSASALLSAGATGPPNPFARPAPPQTNGGGGGGGLNIDTPVSALPSRFLNNEFLPSPSSFYPNWDFRGNDSNTLPSPLNFATPVVGTGPSFLRDDNAGGLLGKRKSPEASANGAGEASESPEAKRQKAE